MDRSPDELRWEAQQRMTMTMEAALVANGLRQVPELIRARTDYVHIWVHPDYRGNGMIVGEAWLEVRRQLFAQPFGVTYIEHIQHHAPGDAYVGEGRIRDALQRRGWSPDMAYKGGVPCWVAYFFLRCLTAYQSDQINDLFVQVSQWSEERLQSLLTLLQLCPWEYVMAAKLAELIDQVPDA